MHLTEPTTLNGNKKASTNYPPCEFWTSPTSLSIVARSKCSAASATNETPAIAAFSHLLYAAVDAEPATQRQYNRGLSSKIALLFTKMKSKRTIKRKKAKAVRQTISVIEISLITLL